VDRLRIGRRGAAWCVALGGMALHALSDPVLPREPLRHGASTVLAADFHVHSFPGDGGLLPWDIATEARRRRLDVVALTNHNTMLSSWLMGLMPRPDGAMLIPGVELTSAHYHLATVGVHSPVPWRQSVAASAAGVQAQGGVAIAAHPVPPIDGGFDHAALDALHGIEAAHPLMHDNPEDNRNLAAFRQRAFAHRASLAAIGSSDFHFLGPIGLCRTFVFVTEPSPAGVLDAVRRGATVACDGRGDTYGPAELSAAVAGECRRVATARPEGWTWLTPAGAWITWLGFVGLVLIGARE
jgi:hypothetical protein